MRLRVPACAAVLLLLTLACSNSESAPRTEARGDDEEKVAVDAPGVTDSEIRVGGVASVTNPLGGEYGDTFKGVEAYFQMVNEDGGIHGRELSLVSKRDDKLASNEAQIQALLAQDNVFAVLPVATLLFTGADTLVEANVPTFGWTINPEWQGTEQEPKENLFGQAGSYLCFDCEAPIWPWLAQEVGATKVGVIAYNVAQSSECAEGIRKSIERWGPDAGVEVGFVDTSLSFGTTDLSVQVSQMKQAGVDFITSCVDLQGVVTLAKEVKKQDLGATQFIPNGYDQSLVDEFGDLFEDSYVLTFFAPFESEQKPEGLQTYLEWMERTGTTKSENSLNGWLNAALFVQGLRDAGPKFNRQKVIDAINEMTNWDADGLLCGVDWTVSHNQPSEEVCSAISKVTDGSFEPAFAEPGKPFLLWKRDAPLKDPEIVAGQA